MVNRENGKKRQQGIILVISVIMLVVVTGLSIIILSSAVMGKLFSYNDQDQMLAKGSADYAVTAVKQMITDSWGVGMTECTNAPCTCPTPPIPCIWQKPLAFNGLDLTAQSASFWSTYASSLSAPNSEVLSGPQYIAISLGCDNISNVNLFRIVTRAVGATSKAIAYSEVTFPMPLNANNITASTGQASVTPVVNGANQTVQSLGLSTTRAFYQITAGSVCTAGYSIHAECQRGCGGLLRVMARSYDGHCIDTYGEWSTTTSQVIITQGGSPYTFICHY